MNNSMTAAEAVVDALIAEGIEVVFGMTGDTVLPLLDAMYHRQDEIRYVTARVETGATSMADTYSRTTGKIGCCLFHVGPSVANTVLGAWSAQKDAVPLLVMSANMDTFRLERNIWHEFDVMGVYSKFTKWQGQLAQAKDARRLMRNAFQAAKSGMPGVVHIDFPKDILPQPADVESTDLSLLGGAHSDATANHPRPEAWAVDTAAELLQQADKPLVLAGRGVRWGDASAQLVALAESMAIPVITTEMGRGTIPEDHPLAGGLVGHFGHSAANGLLREADVVLGLGSRFLNVSTINWSMIAPDTKIIQVETDPLEIGKQYAVALGIHADSGAFLDDLNAKIGAPPSTAVDPDHPRVKRVAELMADQNARYYDTDIDAVPIKPQRITRAIEEVCDRDAIFVFGSGLHTQFAHGIQIRSPEQYNYSIGSGTMAWALPGAIGAKIAHPDRQVVVCIGDGDFGMNAQEIETSVREKTPIIIVVYNDCSFGALRVFQKQHYGGRYIGSHFGQTDHAKLAEAYGARGERVESPSDLAGALERAAAADVTTVIDVMIDGWEPHYRVDEFAEFHKF
jgi:acetolactate synthase I/II/III large subunit